MCKIKGKSVEACQNYIMVVKRPRPDMLLVCGTNAYKPKCRHYKIEVSPSMILIQTHDARAKRDIRRTSGSWSRASSRRARQVLGAKLEVNFQLQFVLSLAVRLCQWSRRRAHTHTHTHNARL